MVNSPRKEQRSEIEVGHCLVRTSVLAKKFSAPALISESERDLDILFAPDLVHS